MMPDDMQRTEVRRPRDVDDAARRAKLIFLSLAAAVAVLLIASFVYASRARSERNALREEVEQLRLDNQKLTQWLEERTREVEQLKKKLQASAQRQTPKSQTKKTASSTSKKKPASKSTTTKRTRR